MIIAQLSDIHIKDDASLARLDQVLDWLSTLRPDAIAVSGDLANLSHQSNYEMLRARLETFGVPVLVVPGNVDNREAMRTVFGGPQTGPLNRVVAVADSLRLVGLDVTIPGAVHGDAAPVRDWLEHELNSGGPPALVFLHQHPFNCGMDEYETIDCRNQEALSAVIGRARDSVLGIFCGHLHRPMFARFAELPAAIAPSVAPAGKLVADGHETTTTDPPGLLVHHVKDGMLVSHMISIG
ncbi:metallophosphoesterase [Devosia nitrariae]|uniref:3',5'-cyclic adenosine monophosphate phosphodiesterase CpdA n=1 Tax=Devosia nitrariae TaxID=2071872 RepID=A0ABQ5W0Z1_9HYPH|nr:metallophosphoesterase [Devosia nitrariae]GLQ53541.1 3',5'-cyclic adenosine monophosphate phosphodiesterase CpdA [Devosia nitrariae]